MKYVVVGMGNLCYINHSSFRTLWSMVKCGNSTIHYNCKNCYFFVDLEEIIFRTWRRVSGLVQYN